MKTILSIICAGVLFSTTGCLVVHDHGRHHDAVVVAPVPPPPVVVVHAQ